MTAAALAISRIGCPTAITGVHEIAAGQHAVARFEGLGEVAARVVSGDTA
ncbi:hypothetical protein N6L26_08615 [Qipengyuania sp. SS22]|nr:hypothetical protein [Qipengyuania sp. SS22]UYH54122.1 hypothetical protein N6L26_08615 [Qipengyuania sp. SS22]